MRREPTPFGTAGYGLFHGDPSPLENLFYLRRSCRDFKKQSLPLSAVARLLYGAYGITGSAQLEGDQTMLTRTVPSAGGLYPLELYAVTNDVDGIKDGLYHYDVLHHCLEWLPEGPRLEEMGSCLMAQYFLQNANVVLFFAAVFSRTLNKYGPRGYRYVLLEAGHCAQNICLLVAEMNLAALCVGGFHDSQMNRMLGLDGRSEAVVYCLGIGHAAG
ncbi:MAG: SagB/ThcOx family dehydrogenase [Acidobacteriia bacterium]|nr:SagB/ThcOx family dehydrogenase [Terriglobia bacterium]